MIASSVPLRRGRSGRGSASRHAPHDLRLGGRWTALQHVKNALIYGCVRAWLPWADHCAPSELLAAGRTLGELAHDVLGYERARARTTLALVLPGCDAEQLAWQCFVRAGENLARCWLLRRPEIRALDQVHVPAPARALLADACGSGRGVVFVSAHLGPFEWLPAALVELGYAPAVVVRESYDPRLDRVVDAHRLARGIEVLHRSHPATTGRLLRALRAGRPVGFLPDLGARVASVPCRFLGHPAELPVGPQRIARRTGARVLVGVLARRETGPATFDLTLEEVQSSDEHTLTQRVADTLTGMIRGAPADWLWMGARFPTLQKNRVERYT